MSGSWRARRLSTLALLLASFGAALLLAEATLRALRPPAASVIHYPCIYVEDERFGFRYQPGAAGRIAGHFEIDNLVQINALGFYDDDPLPAGASELRVLAVGDSFTAGLNLDRDEVWTAVLERELRERGHPSADVVNLGLDGTGTEVHRDLLRAFIPELRPDVVILAFYANDIDDVLHGRFSRECYRGYVLAFQDELQRMILRRRVEVHLDRRFARWLFDHSFLVRMLEFLRSGNRNLFRLHYVQPTAAELGIDDAVKRERRPRLRAVFADLEELARGCGCRFLVAPVPPRRSLDGSLRVFRRWVGDAELELIDAVPAMERMLAEDGRSASDLFWANDNHLNAYGNRLFARALAEAAPLRADPSRRPQ
jgi:lysophospholipase L1-like esterase